VPQDAITHARVNELLRRTPVAVAVNGLVGLASCWAMLREGDAGRWPVYWLAGLWAVLAVRLVAWRLDRRAAPSGAARARIATLGALATGLAWGISASLLLPQAPVNELLVTFAVGGMCAGSVTLNAAHLPTLTAFVLAACVPAAIGLFARGTDATIAMGLMTLIFAGALLFTGSTFSATFTRRIMLEHELNAANARLREEIAERNATEDRLRQSQKLDAIGQLTAGVAHDFNNLLMVITGHTDALLALGMPSDVERRAAAIRDAATRGSQLTRQLLAFGRRQRLEPRVIDLNALLGEMSRLLGRTLGRKISVAFEPADGLWPVLVDAGQIEHAVLNLAINARDAMPDGGTITIATANLEVAPPAAGDLPPGQYVRLTVRDTGTGMSPEVLARAVEPFFTTKMPGQGSGLGLSQVHGLVHQSGGTLAIRSEENRGTTVEVDLPRAPGAPRGEAEYPGPGV
jgi:signal transduction histidine kinase